MRKTKSRKRQNRLEELLEIPKEISSQEAKITVVGFEQMLIENYKGILEYQEFYIRISTHIGIVNVNGFNLKLEEMTSDDIMVKGKIESIDFENQVDEGEESCT
ncbi:MAG: YabP/YqfC family sporulation protein [Clostridia bacterium]